MAVTALRRYTSAKLHEITSQKTQLFTTLIVNTLSSWSHVIILSEIFSLVPENEVLNEFHEWKEWIT
jgi:hypothetical protein